MKSRVGVILMAATMAWAAQGQQPQAAQSKQPSPPDSAESSSLPPIEPHVLMEKQKQALDQQRSALEQQRFSIDGQRQAIAARALKSPPAGFGASNPYYIAAVSSESPVLVVTSKMDDRTSGEWKEDLTIMHKLLRDAIEDSGARSAQAMGILVRPVAGAPPLYMEDCGLVFRMSVNFPIASSGTSPTTATTASTTRPSAWEMTKRELSGEIREESGFFDASGHPKPPVRAPFDPARLDALVDAILGQLPEASHFRHLKPEEMIFVTVSGTDDAGAIKRLTLKAKKSDIDDVAAGRIKADEFKHRVARSVYSDAPSISATFGR